MVSNGIVNVKTKFEEIYLELKDQILNDSAFDYTKDARQ
jgi:hypothetical protein